MSRAFVSRSFAVAVLASTLFMWSDSRGDAPPQKSHALSESAAAAKSAGKGDSHLKSKEHKPVAPETTSGTGGEAKIEAALDQPLDMEYPDTPLKDIVDSLSSRLGITIVLDTKALADASVTPDTTFAKTIRGIPLRSALHLLLADHDLNSYVDSDVLLITTNDIAKAHTVIRVYDISAFAETAESVRWEAPYTGSPTGGVFQVPPEQVAAQQAGPAKPSPAPPGAAAAKKPPASRTASAPNGCITKTQKAPKPGEVDFDALAEVVTTTVAPTTWDANGGTGSISYFGGNMVVAQTEEVQAQLAALLEALKPRATPALLASSGPLTFSSREAKIEKELDAPVDMEYADTPLKDIVDSLSSRLGITIQLDAKALADASVTPDTTFNRTIRGVPLRQALHLLLADHDLSYVVMDDILLITTNDIAKATTHIVIYPVDQLVGTAGPLGGDSYDDLIETIVGTVAPTTWDINGGVGSISPYARSKLLVIDQAEEVQREVKGLLLKLAASRPAAKSLPGQPAAAAAAATSDAFVLHAYDVRAWYGEGKDARQFVELTKKLIEPKSWSQADAYIGTVGDLVVVRQKPEVHQQIQRLINELTSSYYSPPNTVPVNGMGGGMMGGTGGMGGGFGGGGTPAH